MEAVCVFVIFMGGWIPRVPHSFSWNTLKSVLFRMRGICGLMTRFQWISLFSAEIVQKILVYQTRESMATSNPIDACHEFVKHAKPKLYMQPLYTDGHQNMINIP